MSATAAASALLGCNEAPPEHIVPYVERPPGLTPGRSRYYATSALRRGVAVGVLGESREGRPIKIEGNPLHPFSLGATGPVEQALPMTLYDTDRLSAIVHRGAPASFEGFARALGPDSARRFVRNAGDGLHLWMSPTSSPLIERLLSRVLDRYPRAQVWFDPSLAPLTMWEATERVLGRVLTPQYRFELADRVLALDSELLAGEPGSTRWSFDWAQRRRPEDPRAMSRCYAIGATPTGTSAAFDHRLIARSSEIGAIAAAFLAAIGAPGSDHRWLERAPGSAWIEIVARDLVAHRERTIVIAGDRQPAHVHALALALNEALGSFDHTVTFTEPPWMGGGGRAFAPEMLMAALDAGDVDALLCLGGNPAYTAGGTLRWAQHAARAGDLVALTEHPSETADLASWVIPQLHLLERWGDARAHDGTWSVVQPLIRPLFNGHAAEEVLLALTGERERLVRSALADLLEERGHDLRDVLSRGFVPDSAFETQRVEPRTAALAEALAELEASPRAEPRAFELDLRPDPRLEDGAHADNAWLQELPETMTKLVWDNAAILAEEDATALGLAQGDVVEIATGEGSIRLPVQPMRAHAPRTIVAWLGFGRRAGGRVARQVGVDVGPLRSRSAAWWIADVRVRATGEHVDLATTQPHDDIPEAHEMPVVLRESLHHLERHPRFAEPHDEAPPSLYPDVLEADPQWGMGIDLNLCTGCQACVVACQVENNVPVVGKTQVRLGRAMHWLRIDRYFHGREHVHGGELRTSLQPMLCQHCEKAPCEYVCPVNATVHSPDGLNEMVYNRCVGTRFCSNNCPYKIRRFNWYDWHADAHEPETMKWNPDVSVRGRGVMEKCTYCVQRIRREQIEARNDGRELRDGDVVTACQQACPTHAIEFGNVADPGSRVSRWHAADRTYAVLNALGTRPRTRYLARIDNLNRELSEE